MEGGRERERNKIERNRTHNIHTLICTKREREREIKIERNRTYHKHTPTCTFTQKILQGGGGEGRREREREN